MPAFGLGRLRLKARRFIRPRRRGHPTLSTGPIRVTGSTAFQRWPFFYDELNGTGTLESRTPDEGGPWSLVSGASASVASGRATTSAIGVYLAGTTAPADYVVRAVLLPVISEEEGEEPAAQPPNVRICGRMSTEGDMPDDMYIAWFKPSGLAGRWTLTSRIAGSETDLDDGPTVSPPSEPTTVELLLGPDYRTVKVNGEVVASNATNPATTTLTQDLTLPAATVDVADTFGFPTPSGSIHIGDQTVTYTARGTASFLGCSGGVGTFPAGTVVTQVLPMPTGGVPGLHWSASGTSAPVESFTATELSIHQRRGHPTQSTGTKRITRSQGTRRITTSSAP